jgi:L-phenylalanine/L-methionine N-acetyltransferase
VLIRALEPADLPALQALCARSEIAADLDQVPGEEALQAAPGVHAALGAFEAGRLLGAAGMTALDRPRLRHAGHAWLAAGPDAAVPLLAALRDLARDWWKLDRLDLVVPAATPLLGPLVEAGFLPEVRRRLDLAQGGAAFLDSVGHAWVRPGPSAPRSSRAFPRAGAGPLPPSFEIRRSRPEDAEAYARVFAGERAVWGTLQTPFPSVEVWRKRLLGLDPARHRNFVAAVGEEVVATGGLWTAGSPRRGHVWLVGMGVGAGWQGRGVGRALLRHLVELGDAMGVRRLELDVYADNAPAIALYQAFGFAGEGVKRLEAWRDGAYVDGLVMGRVR